MLVADPVRLARRRPGIGHVGLIAERCQRRANDLDAGGVRAQRHLVQAGNYVLGGDLLLGLRPPITQIICAEHDSNVRDARLGQNVAVEAPEPAVAADVVQDAVAAEPVVHDADRSARSRDEPPRQLIRPAAERFDRRNIVVGQRVSERDYSERTARGENVDATKEKPLVGQISDRHYRLSGEIAGGEM